MLELLSDIFKFFSGIRLFLWSLVVIGYLGFMILNYHFIHYSGGIMGLITELFTIPSLLMLPVLLICAIFNFFRDIFNFFHKKCKIDSYTFISFVMLLVINLFLLGSFFYPELINFK